MSLTRKLSNMPPTPEKILSGLILCRSLMEISDVICDEIILSLLCVQYDEENERCYEYDTINSKLPSFEYVYCNANSHIIFEQDKTTIYQEYPNLHTTYTQN